MSQYTAHTAIVILARIALGLSVPVQAATFTIDDENDLFLGVGDYAAVAGYDGSTPPTDSQAPMLKLSANASNTLNMGELWSTLDAGGVTSTSVLVFGMYVKQKKQQPLNVETLSMTFDRGGGVSDSFSLSPDQLLVADYRHGKIADARIQVNLGFDFMAEYNASSLEDFTISATVNNLNAGPDYIFLSSGFTGEPLAPEEPIPEPGTLVLFVSVMIVAALARRKWGKRKGSPSSDDKPSEDPPA